MSERAKLVFSHPAFETGSGIMRVKEIYSEFVPVIGDHVQIDNTIGKVLSRTLVYDNDRLLRVNIMLDSK